MLDSRMKLRDMVEPVALDFSKLLDGISEGAKMFSDQKFRKSNISSEAQMLALDALKGLGNAHWAAAGLLAIATVLERLDKISKNDRECIDLLKGMLDLAKFIKMLKDLHADFHKGTLAKMSDALHLIVSGAVLCHSFIRCNKISKFLLTKKISEELVYLRGEVDGMKSDIDLHMNYIIACSVTFTFHASGENQHDGNGKHRGRESRDAGGVEERNTITGEFPVAQSNHIQSGEIIHIRETGTSTADPDPNPIPTRLHDVNSNKKNPQKLVLLTFLRLGRFLEYTAHSVTKLATQRFEGWKKSLQNDSSYAESSSVLDQDSLSQFASDRGLQWRPIRFTFLELVSATKDFQDHLGHGPNGGAVYDCKGAWHGKEVVIKRSSNESPLLNELLYNVYLQHRNILNLVGYCITEKELMLVYDYMPNGNLSQLLFDASNSRSLDWSTRKKIILGVINVIVYLHNLQDVSIVHRDINPRNIFVDENFNAKLSGFGIAKTLKRGCSPGLGAIEGNSSDIEKYSTPVDGTFGYIDPEYSRTSCVSSKSDVFSYGMLLLNIISCRKYLEFTNMDGKHNLLERAFTLQRNNGLEDLVDRQLIENQHFCWPDVLRVIQIALWCVQVESKRRPPASQVLVMLSTETEIPPPPDPFINLVYLRARWFPGTDHLW